MKSIISLSLIVSVILLTVISCGDDEQAIEIITDKFDRQEMLIDWADLIIIPAYEAYNSSLTTLVDKKNVFITASTDDNLESLRAAYIDAYKLWQRVSMFDIGKAEEIKLRNFTNIFPTDIEAINDNISSQVYNLDLPSNYDAQGFPAIDYLLYGIADKDADIKVALSKSKTLEYLNELITKLHRQSDEVLSDWKSTYRATFINNSGASATASVDKMVNDYIFYYEKFFRAGKVGIPAGVFSGSPIADAVEAPYSNIYTKELFFVAFNAVQDFYAGRSFDGNTQGESLQSYLKYMQEQNNTTDISTKISDQWTTAASAADLLSESFQDQVNTDNILMLNTYDQLQKTIILLKVDMLQALNIQVDFVDADGD